VALIVCVRAALMTSVRRRLAASAVDGLTGDVTT